MKITLSNQIEIQTTPAIKKQIIKQFTFANPKYQDTIDFGRSVYNIYRTICLVESSDDGLVAPTGTLDYLVQEFNPEVIDKRYMVTVGIPFTGTLRPYQEIFITDALKAKGGQMVSLTGSGKTVCGIAMASRLEQRTLILVKSKDLAKQWVEAIKQFTGLDAGLIGGGKNIEGKQFTIGLTQTLSKRNLSELNYGLIIADECHNLPASQAYAVMNGINAKYKYGLSATPQRRDNLEFMIAGAIGNICSEIQQSQLEGKVLPVHISTVKVPFPDVPVESWAEFLTIMVNDEARNQIIVSHAVKVSKTMGTIILCAQVRHCELLSSMCRDSGVDALVLHGQLPAKVRTERMEQAQEAQLIIGTLSLLSEGIDLPHLSALIFGAPVSAVIKNNPAATRLIQSIGRCRRPYPNKTRAYVLDIIDAHPLGESAWRKRSHIYQLQGFEVRQ